MTERLQTVSLNQHGKRSTAMYKVVTKRYLNDAKSICLFEVEAPLVAKHAQAGQFVIFRLDEHL